MYLYKNRLETFTDWPFTGNCNCTPENMAKAGFIYRPSENEPDVAMCFFCLKELEGWEPQDDPLQEHLKRGANCGFLTMKKYEELTVEEFYKLELHRVQLLIYSYNLWGEVAHLAEFVPEDTCEDVRRLAADGIEVSRALMQGALDSCNTAARGVAEGVTIR
ncbi:baculoviral IAP repeat-containing protein 5-like [Latimeria chalumnae]|uniref:baculoviral IAP repeat-containing protein 5-like n=1 Tax=Latimeria chalumnae TaxID=7897 RepID=UPI00313BEA25